MASDFSIGNRLFFTSGDFSFNQYSVTVGLVFGQKIHAELELDCPYELVRSGQWTIDRFASMARAALADLNGDAIMDENDRWGFVSQAHTYVPGFMSAAGVRYVIKDADDLPVLNVLTEDFTSRFLAVYDIITEGWILDPSRPAVPNGIAQGMFINSQTLFWSTPLNAVNGLRAMDTDFGILPYPKLSEQQPYHISSTGVPHVMCIPVTTSDLKRTGIILEALNAESRLTALTIYYDTMLLNQVLNRDEESAVMLEIIFANRIYDKGRHFWIDQIASPISNAVRDFNREIVSILERNETVANAAIDSVIAAFLSD
jgi:hypothetical protein